MLNSMENAHVHAVVVNRGADRLLFRHMTRIPYYTARAVRQSGLFTEYVYPTRGSFPSAWVQLQLSCDIYLHPS